MAALPNATLVCDQRCADTLGKYYDSTPWKMQIVATGDTISLGKRTLSFIETPMAHWPDSMFTYVPEEKLLFSMDAFGQHYATGTRFDDEAPLCTIMEEAKIYYANIVMPFGRIVSRLLTAAADIPMEIVAPSHGVIWRSHIPKIIEAYANWAVCKPKPKVLVVYDTMWNSTEMMARAIMEGASQPGVEAHMHHIRSSDLTRLATEIIDTAAVAVGTATLNQGMMPMAGAMLTYWKGLKPTGKAGFTFGSYGWSKGGAAAALDYFKAMKWQITREPLEAQYRPTPEDLAACREAGKELAAKALELSERAPGADLCQDV
jgi:flavorubredoxin